jgi:hypothetical protein
LAIASYVNVPSTDKLHVAEQVFAVVEDAASTSDTSPFANKAAVATALDTPTTGIIAEYKALVAEYAYVELTDTATTVTQLGLLGYAAFDNLSTGDKASVAEAFKASIKNTISVAIDARLYLLVKWYDSAIGSNNGEVLPTHRFS